MRYVTLRPPCLGALSYPRVLVFQLEDYIYSLSPEASLLIGNPSVCRYNEFSLHRPFIQQPQFTRL